MIPLETTTTGVLDIHKLVVKNPESTFFFRVKGDGLIDEYLQDGDILVVDRSLQPFEGALVVIIAIDELQVVKCDKNILLENALWGVVSYVISPR